MSSKCSCDDSFKKLAMRTNKLIISAEGNRSERKIKRKITKFIS